MNRYVIIAGVNGAGKSTFYSTENLFSNIEKVNLDDVVREIGESGNIADVVKAGKIVINQINDYFENGISFSQETTLCGKSIFKNIDRAKKLGYTIELYYVGLDSAELAKQRVKHRVEHGGHDISDEDVERRYIETLQNLKIVLEKCDLAAIYDNTDKFRRFAIFKDGKCVRLSSYVPDWYKKAMDVLI